MGRCPPRAFSDDGGDRLADEKGVEDQKQQPFRRGNLFVLGREVEQEGGGGNRIGGLNVIHAVGSCRRL